MKRITKQEYEVAKNHGLLYDGIHIEKSTDKVVANRALYNNNMSGRNFIRTKHHYFITSGNNGIDGSVDYFMKKDLVLEQ